MKNKILGNIHWLIILYALNNLFVIYEEKTEEISLLEQSTQTSEQQINISKKKLKQIEKFKENLVESKERVREVVKQIEKAQKQLPADSDETKVAGFISSTARDFKITDVAIEPKEENLKGFYYTKDYVFKGTGTFLQGLILLENLERSERLLNVKSLEMINEKESRRGKFQILKVEVGIESYRYNSDFKETSGVEEIEKKFIVK